MDIDRIDTTKDHHTKLVVKSPLASIYDRTTVEIYANVVDATQGSAVEDETLGSSDSMSANQAFLLKEGPLTYLPSGPHGEPAPALKVTVNGGGK